MALSISLVDTDADATNTASRSYTGLSFGAADTNRYIVIATTGGAAVLNSVTIGGVAATINNGNPVKFAWAKVPTGTTGDISLSYGTSTNWHAIAVFRVVGANSIGQFAAAFDSTYSSGFEASLEIPTDGVGLGFAYGSAAEVVTHTWTNLTEQSDESFEETAGTVWVNFSAATSASAGTSTRTVTTSNAGGNGLGLLSLQVLADQTLLPSLFTNTNTINSHAIAQVVIMTPDADDTDGSWLNESDSNVNLYASIDEVAANDSDYIYSDSFPSHDICKIRLSNPSGSISGNMKVEYRYRKAGTANLLDLTVRLKEGTTTIASWTHADIQETNFTTVTQDVSAPEFASISDFDNLYLEFDAHWGAQNLTPSLFTNTNTVYNPFVGDLPDGVTLTAGDSGFGYTGYDTGVIGTYGSISAEPVSGLTLVYFLEVTGTGEAYIAFNGDQTSTLSGLTVWVDGIEYPFDVDWAYDGTTYTSAQWAAGNGPNLLNTTAYTVAIE